ncbi:hypothetical protein Hypma_014495 [Hypsizygus marmoreus]|uniref:Uncharacterized protein n=1 Tax=Hypsizygus marmoreus TaxID=39966 RepID=A0A369J9S4_HYPMA|nr:hypothetical protein Hypma_014495 [Hypsizygus marmoreus]
MKIVRKINISARSARPFGYLSFVMCQCTSNVACVDHAGLLFTTRGAHQITLRKRFSDEELLETQAKVAERAAVPSTWRNKLNKLLLDNSRPALRSLRALLAEGHRINYHLPELTSLRNVLVGLAEDPPIALDDPGDRPDRGLDDLYALLREVENLGFDCPEIGVLRSLAQQAEDTKKKASALLSSSPSESEQDSFLQECKTLLLDASSINVLLEELSSRWRRSWIANN